MREECLREFGFEDVYRCAWMLLCGMKCRIPCHVWSLRLDLFLHIWSRTQSHGDICVFSGSRDCAMKYLQVADASMAANSASCALQAR